jgi:hypothetical protein
VFIGYLFIVVGDLSGIEGFGLGAMTGILGAILKDISQFYNRTSGTIKPKEEK